MWSTALLWSSSASNISRNEINLFQLDAIKNILLKEKVDFKNRRILKDGVQILEIRLLRIHHRSHSLKKLKDSWGVEKGGTKRPDIKIKCTTLGLRNKGLLASRTATLERSFPYRLRIPWKSSFPFNKRQERNLLAFITLISPEGHNWHGRGNFRKDTVTKKPGRQCISLPSLLQKHPALSSCGPPVISQLVKSF